jgi:hypothetical protein
MEKKSVVTTPKGYTIRVADHMLSDLAKFGATKTKPILKPVPKELLEMPKKAVFLKGALPEMKEVIPETLPEPTPKVRKAPVRSKATK